MNRIEEIKNRLGKATPAPWEFWDCNGPIEDDVEAFCGITHLYHDALDDAGNIVTEHQVMHVCEHLSTAFNTCETCPGGECSCRGEVRLSIDDARLIANAPSDLTWLISRVEELEAEIQKAGKLTK